MIPENAFEQKKKKPRLRANQPSDNWAHAALKIPMDIVPRQETSPTPRP